MNYLTNAYRREVLSSKIKERASKLFSEDISVFEIRLGYELPDVQNMAEDSWEHERQKEEVERLERLVAEQAEALLREKAVSERLEGLLRDIMGRGNTKN